MLTIWKFETFESLKRLKIWKFRKFQKFERLTMPIAWKSESLKVRNTQGENGLIGKFESSKIRNVWKLDSLKIMKVRKVEKWSLEIV